MDGRFMVPDDSELRWVRLAWRPPQLLEPKSLEAACEEIPAEAQARQMVELTSEAKVREKPSKTCIFMEFAVISCF